GTDPDGAGTGHRHGAFRRRRGGQHHAGADHPALRPAAVHHEQDLGRAAPPHRARYHAVPLRHGGGTGADHLRAGDRAVAAAPAGISRIEMTKPIYVLNGPNLNRLGRREPEIYGTTSLAEVEELCRAAAGERELVFRQTNSEERLIDWVHEAIDEAAGIVINPAAFTFTSLALLDALKMFPGPIIEYH